MTIRYENSDRQCPTCGGRVELEVDIEPLLGNQVDRTEQGYNCLNPDCGKRFFPNQVPPRP